MSFSYLNETVDNHFQCWYTDTRVRIAVLDTGFDLAHKDFQQARPKEFTGEFGNIACPAEGEPTQRSRIVESHNFCPDQAKDDINDLDGHGTQVAGIILRVAPNADLCIARICTGDINHGVPKDKAQNVETKDFHKPQPQVIEEVSREQPPTSRS
jgi:hypothetical protein